MSQRHGFTLIEMLCAMAVAGIVLAVIGNMTTSTLHWQRWGFQEQVIGEQFEQALDLIEEDVRGALDVDVSDWSHIVALEEVKQTSELRLWTVDSTSPRRKGKVVYFIARSGNAMAQDMPLERPEANMNLMRRQRDDTHSGAAQPVVFYVNSIFMKPKGLEVHYYNRLGQACSLAEDIYSLRVVLNGQTEDGTVVSRERTIPLSTKYE